MTDARERRCTWCGLPQFGENACICDSPDYELMEQCSDCGAWKQVDHLHVPDDADDEAVVCTGRCIATDGGIVTSADGMEHYGGTLNHPDGDRCDLEFCQRCGHAFTTAIEGYWVGPADVGPDAEGGTAEVFRLDVEEQLGHEWKGFKEEDIGAWCDQCSWILQRKRTRYNRSPRTESSQEGDDD